jgi:phytoene dehydrogenase-like protein
VSSSLDVADAVVIGAGPNGLVAAITLARKGWDVTVLERAPVPGGAIRTEDLTLPGYRHDTFSAFYGLLHSTPVFGELGLGDAVEWAHFETPVAAAVDPLRVAAIHRDPGQTEIGLGKVEPGDGEAWRELVAWWRAIGSRFFAVTLAPIPSIRPTLRFARATGIRGGLETARTLLAPIEEIARERFSSDEARALIASGQSHSDVSIEGTGSTPTALILAMLAQEVGMPVPVGGAGELARALATILTDAGGTIRLGDPVTKIVVERGRAYAVATEAGYAVRARHAVIADTGPRALFHQLVGDEHVPPAYLDGLRRYRYGTGMFKMDLALDGPVPWTADGLAGTGVVHLTGTLDDMARATFESGRGMLPAKPWLIVGQQSIADPSRAPAGKHTLWIETHVPPHPTGDGAGLVEPTGWADAREAFAERVLDRIEEHAPGFRARVLGTSMLSPHDLEGQNPNLIGGDVGGGSGALHQQLVFRPVPGWFRYRTPVKGLYLCSASTHPGGGVHGMGGRNAARRVLKDSHRPGAVFRTAGGARRRPSRA